MYEASVGAYGGTRAAWGPGHIVIRSGGSEEWTGVSGRTRCAGGEGRGEGRGVRVGVATGLSFDDSERMREVCRP